MAGDDRNGRIFRQRSKHRHHSPHIGRFPRSPWAGPGLFGSWERARARAAAPASGEPVAGRQNGRTGPSSARRFCTRHRGRPPAARASATDPCVACAHTLHPGQAGAGQAEAGQAAASPPERPPAIRTGMNGAEDAPLHLFGVGGGINGAGIACDAVGRTLTVGLCEMNDFASATSSASSKLIHGGLRYLEHYEFRLVREALMEREVLLAKAPHLAFPLLFVLPHEPHLRPRWMLRLGLFLYDHLDWHMTLPKSQAVDLPASKYGEGLKPSFKKGFVYSDAWVDDARLVISNLKSAREMGARIFSRHRCISARRSDDGKLWHIELAGPDGPP